MLLAKFLVVSCRKIRLCYNFCMEHQLKLQPQYFDFILYGTKRIELRLYDEKRQRLQIGDTLTFVKEPDRTETLTARIVGLLHYRTFADLLADFDIAVLADKSMTKAALLAELGKFYPPAEQARYSVVGIKIELL